MSTSGSTNFTATRNEVILDAFQILGVYGIGRTVSAEDMTFAASMLNKMVKAWSAKGLHLWAREEATLFITPNIAEYTLASTAKAANTSDTILTRLNGAHVAADTTLVVDDTTGMANSDVIGIVTTDKTIHWTTISSVTSSTGITLTSGLDSAASDNALIYTYTTALEKPLRILDARLRQGFDSGATSDVVDICMAQMPYQDYFQNPVKGTSGLPIQFSYAPQRSNGKLYIWPRPDDGAYRVHFTYERIIEDLDNTANNFDFPNEWLEALTYQLAVRLARPFGKPSAIQDILPLASQMLSDLLDWDREVCDMNISPDLQEW